MKIFVQPKGKPELRECIAESFEGPCKVSKERIAIKGLVEHHFLKVRSDRMSVKQIPVHGKPAWLVEVKLAKLTPKPLICECKHDIADHETVGTQLPYAIGKCLDCSCKEFSQQEGGEHA